MHVVFQLFDVPTGNLVTEFQSEREAIKSLNSVLVDEGTAPLLESALFRFQGGRPTFVAKEDGLVSYVTRAQAVGWDKLLDTELTSPVKTP